MTWYLFAYWYEPDAVDDEVGLVRVWQLVDYLRGLGEEVIIFAPDYRSLRSRSPGLACPISLIQLPLLRPLSYAVRSFWAALRSAKRGAPDLLYYRWMDSPHVVLLGRLLRRPCVCEVNGEPLPTWHEGDPAWKRRIKQALARWTLRRCDGVVTLTEGLRTLLCNEYGVAPERILVLPSGSDPERFRPSDRQMARGRLGLAPDSEWVGFVGTFYDYQGVSCLLEAFARLIRRRPRLRLLLVGDGECAEDLREQADRLGVLSFITWAGRVPYDQVPLYISAMDVCAAPFRADRGETSPVKVFDYLACARPVVASAIDSVSAVFSDQVGVVLVTPDDPAALAEKVDTLLADRGWAAGLGEKGRRFVEERGSWTRMMTQLSRWVRKDRTSTHANSCVL